MVSVIAVILLKAQATDEVQALGYRIHNERTVHDEPVVARLGSRLVEVDVDERVTESSSSCRVEASLAQLYSQTKSTATYHRRTQRFCS